MKTAEAALREKKFLDLARSAHTQIFEQDGESPIEKILASVIEMDEALWTAMQPQLAEYGAIALLKALVKKTPHVVDDNAQLDLFPNMPRLITFKKRKINLLKATVSELDWYGEWWGLRLEGLARRTEEDLAIHWGN